MFRELQGEGDGMASIDEAELERAMAVAFGENGWARFLRETVDRFGASGGSVFIDDGQDRDMRRPFVLLPTRHTPQGLDEYFDRIPDDPQRPRIAGATRRLRYADQDHVDRDDPRTRDYLKWEEHSFDVRHHMTVVVPDGQTRTVLCLHRRRSDGFFQPSDLAAFDRHAQIVDLATRLSRAHVRSTIDALWRAERQSGRATLLLHRQSGIEGVTPEAARLLEDGAIVRRGRHAALDAASEADRPALRQFLRACWGWGERSTLELNASGSGRRLLLQAMPLLVGGELPWACAFVLVRLEEVGGSFGPAVLAEAARLYLLTPREQQLLLALTAGQPLSRAAAGLGISTNTARVHLRNIFEKTRSNRQSDLVRLLADIRLRL